MTTIFTQFETRRTHLRLPVLLRHFGKDSKWKECAIFSSCRPSVDKARRSRGIAGCSSKIIRNHYKRQIYCITSIGTQEAQRCFSSNNENKDKEKNSEEKKISKDDESNEKEEPMQQKTSTVFQNWMIQLRSPPNMITVGRMASTPFLAYFVISGHHKLAIVGCLAAAASDLLDGYLAKNYGMCTVLGTYLDPFADKMFVNTLALSLWYVQVLPSPLVGLWLLKDTILIGATYNMLQKTADDGKSAFDPLNVKLEVQPTMTSKVNTAFQFITLGVAIVNPVYDMAFTLKALCWITGGTTVASAYSYVGYGGFHKLDNRR